MLRLIIIYALLTFLVVHTFKNWYRGLCALIVMMAFVEHPEMPKGVFEIPGLNPWNLLMLAVVLSWFAHQKEENLKFDFPSPLGGLLVLYLGVIFIGFIRAYTDLGSLAEVYVMVGLEPPSATRLITNDLLNAVKWALPGIFLFSGATTEERKKLAMHAILAAVTLMSLQIIRWMPLSLMADGAALSDRALRVLNREIGYHRVDLAAILSGGFWAVILFRRTIEKTSLRWLSLIVAGIVLLGLILTGGRTGYVTCAAVGLILAVLRYRKYLVLAPLILVAIVIFFPAAQDRFMYGFVEDEDNQFNEAQFLDAQTELIVGRVNLYRVTSGRALVWPFVIDKIMEQPWLGYGQMAMLRSGVTGELFVLFGDGEVYGHPHNAYLELLIDNGILLGFPILLFYWLIVRRGLRVFADKEAAAESVLAGSALCFVAAQLISAIGSQSFYPTAGTVFMWSAVGLLMRILVDRVNRASVESEGSSRALHPGNHMGRRVLTGAASLRAR